MEKKHALGSIILSLIVFISSVAILIITFKSLPIIIFSTVFSFVAFITSVVAYTYYSEDV